MEISVNDLCDQCKSKLVQKKEAESKIYYHIVLFGTEGCEGYRCVEGPDEITNSDLNNMELRARFNSHRRIGMYAFSCEHVIPAEGITARLLKKENVIRLF